MGFDGLPRKRFLFAEVGVVLPCTSQLKAMSTGNAIINIFIIFYLNLLFSALKTYFLHFHFFKEALLLLFFFSPFSSNDANNNKLAVSRLKYVTF